MPSINYTDFTGLRNDRPQWRFENTDLAVGYDIDIDNSGGIARRPGYTLLNGAPAHSLWSNGEISFVAANGSLNLVNVDNSYTPLKTLASNARLSYQWVNDRIYISSETDSAIYETLEGRLRSWGMPVPDLPAAYPTVGSMPAGRYQYVLTYLRNDGQESGAHGSDYIDLPDQGGIIFVLPAPPSDPDITGVILYLTTANGEAIYSAMTVPIAANTITYRNNTLDLNMPLMTQFRQPPPKGHKIKYYRGHLLVAANEAIYPSDSFAFELFDYRNAWALDDRITLIATIEDKDRPGDTQGMNSGLFVGTNRTTGVMIGKDPMDYQFVPKLDYGAVENADTLVDGTVFGDDQTGGRMLPMWLSTRGVCVGMPEMQIKNLTRTRYEFKAAGVGAAIWQPDTKKFIATANF